MTIQSMFTVEGMTLRDWFAGQALAGRLASPEMTAAAAHNHAELARWAYAVAQSMMAQRDQLYANEEHAMWGPGEPMPPPPEAQPK
ncbi:hypothetical protein [Hyalangium rubrum]|uniref:Uncharacterized protein n=1 Tax=Hyalangium rubrum TaxID=3103134 RepID=A0ABU5GW64_9BACT|nr:hypothetical protein [Hyalangium sp. s54d21]MDY7224743.1 hypothetical protein [Hyalangium sp. s54d21]